MRRCLILVALAAAVVSLVTMLPSATARPQYLKGFTETYPGLKEPARDVKCSVCHCGTSKKGNNDYGEVVKRLLGAKNVKNAAAITAALHAAEKEPSSEPGKTFGDLIREGRLPGKCPEEPKRP